MISRSLGSFLRDSGKDPPGEISERISAIQAKPIAGGLAVMWDG